METNDKVKVVVCGGAEDRMRTMYDPDTKQLEIYHEQPVDSDVVDSQVAIIQTVVKLSEGQIANLSACLLETTQKGVCK